MKAVLISIKPKWCELIAQGEKTVEVRKTKPKLETPFKVYIYCTIDGGVKGDMLVRSKLICGKVIGEFVCDRIINIPYIMPYDGEDTSHPMRIDFIYETCVPDWEIDEYLGRKDGYGWHISNLVIYDKPRELREFLIDCKNCGKKFVGDPNCWQGCVNGYRRITRPPQSWCYVEVQE